MRFESYGGKSNPAGRRAVQFAPAERADDFISGIRRAELLSASESYGEYALACSAEGILPLSGEEWIELKKTARTVVNNA